MTTKRTIQVLTIDSTHSYTELCNLGKHLGIDKSPYTNREGTHRHPYTGVYSMLFGPLKHRHLHFAEIGVAGGGSVILWNKYFQHPSTRLDFFDCDATFLKHAASFNLTNTSFHLMDVSVDGDIQRALEGRGDYDVILDDSSHNFTHQIRIIKEALPFIKSGGYMIVEDIFRNIPHENFEKELEGVLPLCAEAYFVLCEHANKYSPGWDNDKILVLVKK